MLQIKRFVALSCALLMLPSSCAAYQGGSPQYQAKMGDAIGQVTTAELASMDPSTRGFEAVEVVNASASGEPDMWSGGELDSAVDGNSIRVEGATLAKTTAAPPPPPEPPAPGLSFQTPASQAPAKESPADKKREESAPAQAPSGAAAATGKKGEADGVAVIRAPMLVYTGRVQMAVYEVKNSLAEVESLAHLLGGFLSKRDDRTITIRVPASRFDEAMRRIEKLGDMLSRDVQVEDVTEEFNDVDIRLKNARAVRDRLEQLLAKASKVEESIQIERELERVALTIERLEGRMKFLRDRATFSTITVVFQPRSAAELGKRPFNLPVPWLYEMGLGRLLAL